MTPLLSEDDFCRRAPAALGHPDATVTRCQALLPDFYWVILAGDSIPGGSVGLGAVLDGGALVRERGGPPAARWLRRTRAFERPDASDVDLVIALDTLAAPPPGFTPDAVHFQDGPSKASGGLTRAPFALTLVAPAAGSALERLKRWKAAEARTPDTGGGDTPTVTVRAVPREVAGGRFEWTVDAFDEGRWVAVTRQGLEP